MCNHWPTQCPVKCKLCFHGPLDVQVNKPSWVRASSDKLMSTLGSYLSRQTDAIINSPDVPSINRHVAWPVKAMFWQIVWPRQGHILLAGQISASYVLTTRSMHWQTHVNGVLHAHLLLIKFSYIKFSRVILLQLLSWILLLIHSSRLLRTILCSFLF